MTDEVIYTLKKNRLPFVQYKIYSEQSYEPDYYFESNYCSQEKWLVDKFGSQVVSASPSTFSFVAKTYIFDEARKQSYTVRKEGFNPCASSKEAYVFRGQESMDGTQLLTIIPRLNNTRYSVVDSGTGTMICQIFLKPRDLPGHFTGEDVYNIKIVNSANKFLMLYLCIWVDKYYSRRGSGIGQKLLDKINSPELD